MKYEINGSVSPGFESVQALFASHLAQDAENHAQLCVYVNGVKVIDLWGSSHHAKKLSPGRQYEATSLQTVFSSGKTLAALAVALLVDKGHLDYDEKVCKYWPEFGQNGKDKLRLEDVMRHEAGLTKLCQGVKLEQTSRESIKANSIGEIIAQTTPKYPAGKTEAVRQYHALTRGWILNEIVRRADPKGRTIGEILYEEVCLPLEADVHVGLREELLTRVFKLESWSSAYALFQSMIPAAWGRKIEPSILDGIRIGWAFFSASRRVKHEEAEEEGPKYPEPLDLPDDMKGGLGIIKAFSCHAGRTGEIPSANAICSARGMAKVAACIVEGGQLEGKRILSEATVAKIHEEPLQKPDYALAGLRTSFSKGGVNHFGHIDSGTPLQRQNYDLRDGYVGWMGLGGSVLQWHPELKIGFGYAKTLLHWYDVSNTRGAIYQNEVVKCVRALQHKL